jgi:DNA primase large subunit
MKRTIKQALDPKYLHDRIALAMTKELERQKAAGKKFITDEEIDELIDRIMQEELGKNKE